MAAILEISYGDIKMIIYMFIQICSIKFLVLCLNTFWKWPSKELLAKGPVLKLCPVVVAILDFRSTKNKKIMKIIIKNMNILEGHIRNIPVKQWCIYVISDIYIFQPIRKHNSPSSHIRFLNGRKILKNVDDQLRNTSAIFSSNLPSSVWGTV